MDILDQLEEMNQQAETRRFNSGYLYGEQIVAYVRVTSRLIDGKMMQTIDIGNVSVYEEHQKKGVFKDFLSSVEEMAHRFDRTVYIESVLSPVLLEKLPQYGYTSNQQECPSFYKTPK
jgi:predicted N-acetyltransferase YhbS